MTGSLVRLIPSACVVMERKEGELMWMSEGEVLPEVGKRSKRKRAPGSEGALPKVVTLSPNRVMPFGT